MTGTLNGGKYSLDVNVSNSTLPIATSSYAYKEHRLHDAATNIEASSGAFIQMATIADLANTIAELRVRNHTGSPLVFSKGADATAAATATNFLGVCHEGGEENFGVSLVSGDKLWVRAMKNVAVTSGEVLAILLG